MNLYIMTRDRVDSQVTLSHLSPKVQERTYLVCSRKERFEHKYPRLIDVPTNIDNYSQKMQWLLNYINKFDKGIGVIMDDDLWFDIRVPNEEKIRKPKCKEEIDGLWEYMEELLQTTALVGIHPRHFGHVTRVPYLENTKIVCVQGVNTNLMPKDLPRIDDYPILSDVWLNCHLLSRGIGNKVITKYVVDWMPCQSEGGCSIYRTPEMQRDCCYALEKAFSPYFKVVVKKAKVTNWLGDERYDFRVRWKGLFRSARSS